VTANGERRKTSPRFFSEPPQLSRPKFWRIEIVDSPGLFIRSTWSADSCFGYARSIRFVSRSFCGIQIFPFLDTREILAPVELRQRSMLRTLLTVFAVAVIVNYLWELAQAPVYDGLQNYSSPVLWHCFVASLGDGVMVLLIAVVGRISLHRWDWFQRPRVAGYLVMLTAGLVLAVLVEWLAVHVLARWQYTARMPLVPGLGIGVVPIAQMLFLPPLIFRIVVILGAKR
jgi:hypothetical protein